MLKYRKPEKYRRLLLLLIISFFSLHSQSVSWNIRGEKKIVSDEAVKRGIEALAELIRIKKSSVSNKIVLKLDSLVFELPDGLSSEEESLIKNSGYNISYKREVYGRVITIKSPNPLGISYGMFRLAEYFRLNKDFPSKEISDFPQFPYRFYRLQPLLPRTPDGPPENTPPDKKILKRFDSAVNRALKNGYNYLILGDHTEDFVPWSEDKYAGRSRKYRRYLKIFLDKAHASHLLLLLHGGEFVYLPSWLRENSASLSVNDPGFWQSLEEKYRQLLWEAPDLDGIATTLEESSNEFGFHSFDFIHYDEDGVCPGMEKRYEKYIKTVYNVVAGEFGKLFFHRAWTPNVYEQHSVPEIFKKIFGENIPAENIVISAKAASGGEWYYYEPFNPVLGSTAHAMVMEGDIYSLMHGGGYILDYPASWFQAALEAAAVKGVKGIFTGQPDDLLLTNRAMFFFFSKLGWNAGVNPEEVTTDWCELEFGEKAADKLADIFLGSASAIRDGLYIRQPGLQNANPLPHIHNTDFVLKGNPVWDKGRGQHEFLYGIYLQCKPWLEETGAELDRGLEKYQLLFSRFNRVKYKISDEKKAEEVEKLLRHGLLTLELNNHYVKSFLDYFEYLRFSGRKNKKRLKEERDNLLVSVKKYKNSFSYFQLYGVNVFIDLAGRALKDKREALEILKLAPTREETAEMLAEARRISEEVLRNNSHAVKFASWKSENGGIEIISIDDNGYKIEHIAYGESENVRYRKIRSLPPDGKYTVYLKSLNSDGHACIMEQPSKENNYTIKIYLESSRFSDFPRRFELYYISE